MPDLPSLPAPAEVPADAYNLRRFRPKHVLLDTWWTLRREGIQPGTVAPDFELPRAEGRPLRLQDLRRRPVLLRFGSFT